MRSTDEDSSAAARTPHPGGVNPSRLDHHPRRMMLRHWPPGAGAGQRVPQSRVLHRESKPDGRMSRENRRHYRRTRGHATWRLCRQLSRERCGRYGVEDRGFSLRRGAGDGGRPFLQEKVSNHRSYGTLGDHRKPASTRAPSPSTAGSSPPQPTSSASSITDRHPRGRGDCRANCGGRIAADELATVFDHDGTLCKTTLEGGV